ncbi:hypothetical protein HPB52_023288 [Rhipicephalus sanguineus]|uniref:Uncharacterized protein n=1 Tax=Rhipicephalus sanguineus TaxID=34632 RepID=A0A9D4TC17_RHISA|nr:hypothetical protein HPB52_023288 [Rhipicephalus sanguineus]
MPRCSARASGGGAALDDERRVPEGCRVSATSRGIRRRYGRVFDYSVSTPSQLPPLPLDVAVSRARGLSRSRRTMSSWRKKLFVKANRNLDVGTPQLGLFEHRGFQRKPSAPDAAKEEPFKRSWSFRIGGSGDGSKTKDASPGGNDKSAFLRMFLFGKDKNKGGHQEPGRRRMSDAAVTEAPRKEELSQWSSVPLDVSESPEAKRRQEAAYVMWAHTLPRSLEAAPGGSECTDDAGGDTKAIWGLIYCDPKAEVNSDLLDYRAPSLP